MLYPFGEYNVESKMYKMMIDDPDKCKKNMWLMINIISNVILCDVKCHSDTHGG